jgi:uncharacterized surface protein with fasciclin (FAS1) repeats
MRTSLLGLSALTLILALSGCEEARHHHHWRPGFKEALFFEATPDRSCRETRSAIDRLEGGAPLYRWGSIAGGSPMAQHKTILENLVCTGRHRFFLAAIDIAGLRPLLSEGSEFTVLAPTDLAFYQLLGPDPIGWMKAERNSGTLAALVSYHILAGARTSHEMVNASRMAGGDIGIVTLSGDGLMVRPAVGGGVSIRDEEGSVHQIVLSDIPQRDGIIHLMNHVLLPHRP